MLNSTSATGDVAGMLVDYNSDGDSHNSKPPDSHILADEALVSGSTAIDSTTCLSIPTDTIDSDEGGGIKTTTSNIDTGIVTTFTAYNSRMSDFTAIKSTPSLYQRLSNSLDVLKHKLGHMSVNTALAAQHTLPSCSTATHSTPKIQKKLVALDKIVSIDSSSSVIASSPTRKETYGLNNNLSDISLDVPMRKKQRKSKSIRESDSDVSRGSQTFSIDLGSPFKPRGPSRSSPSLKHGKATSVLRQNVHVDTGDSEEDMSEPPTRRLSRKSKSIPEKMATTPIKDKRQITTPIRETRSFTRSKNNMSSAGSTPNRTLSPSWKPQVSSFQSERAYATPISTQSSSQEKVQATSSFNSLSESSNSSFRYDDISTPMGQTPRSMQESSSLILSDTFPSFSNTSISRSAEFTSVVSDPVTSNDHLQRPLTNTAPSSILSSDHIVAPSTVSPLVDYVQARSQQAYGKMQMDKIVCIAVVSMKCDLENIADNVKTPILYALAGCKEGKRSGAVVPSFAGSGGKGVYERMKQLLHMNADSNSPYYGTISNLDFNLDHPALVDQAILNVHDAFRTVHGDMKFILSNFPNPNIGPQEKNKVSDKNPPKKKQLLKLLDSDFHDAAYKTLELFNNFLAYVVLVKKNMVPRDADGVTLPFTMEGCFRTIDINYICKKAKLYSDLLWEYLNDDDDLTSASAVSFHFVTMDSPYLIDESVSILSHILGDMISNLDPATFFLSCFCHYKLISIGTMMNNILEQWKYLCLGRHNVYLKSTTTTTEDITVVVPRVIMSDPSTYTENSFIFENYYTCYTEESSLSCVPLGISLFFHCINNCGSCQENYKARDVRNKIVTKFVRYHDGDKVFVNTLPRNNSSCIMSVVNHNFPCPHSKDGSDVGVSYAKLVYHRIPDNNDHCSDINTE